MSSPGPVALLHYHLNGGGVTRVIEQQSRALTELGVPHVVLCGENLSACEVPHRIIPELNFSEIYDESTSSYIIGEIDRLCSEALGSQPALLHFHNHSIGLNPHYGDLVEHYAKSHRMLLQIHDFAEDGRLQNLAQIPSLGQLYPNAKHIHYAAINSRDRTILANAGVNARLLPNSYNPQPVRELAKKKLVFYPIQALRRKNLGELLLLALASPPEFRFAVAKTPPESVELVNFWESTARRIELPILFNVCDRRPPVDEADMDFLSWYAHCSHVVTTAIQEGFGMAYIEPIHYKTPLFGRNLPEITKDVEKEGLSLDHLYHQILVPGAWIEKCDAAPFLREGKAFYDFGNLSEGMQRSLLLRWSENPKELDAIVAQAPSFSLPLPDYVQQALQAKEPQLMHLLGPWSREKLKNNLQCSYEALLNEPIGKPTSLSHTQISESFAQQPFHYLKHTPLAL